MEQHNGYTVYPSWKPQPLEPRRTITVTECIVGASFSDWRKLVFLTGLGTAGGYFAATPKSIRPGATLMGATIGATWGVISLIINSSQRQRGVKD